MKVVCVHCGKSLKAPEKLIGRKVRCPKCGQSFVLKKPAELPDDLDVPLAPLDDQEERERERKRQEVDREFESTGTYGLSPKDDGEKREIVDG